MAEVTAFRNNALPYPVYGVPWAVVFPLLDADGDPVTGATCDSEVAKNGDTGADCTNEGVEITFTTTTNKGMYYLLLTAAEMTADIVTVTIYSATSKATCIVLYPRKLVALRSGTSQGGAAGYITLDASAGANDDTWNGCLCVATIDTLVEARIISDYTGSNQQAAVTPSWNVTPDADDTFVIYLPEGMQRPVVNVRAISDDEAAADNCELMFDGTGYVGGTAKLTVDATKIGGTTQTAGDFLGVWTPTKAGYVDAAITSRHASGAAVAKSPATLATADVTGNLPANVLAWNTGALPTVGDATAANQAAIVAYIDTEIAAILAAVDTEVGAIVTKLAGITSLAAWLRGLYRKDAMDATAKSEVNDTGGTFDEATDSNEGIRDTAPLGTAMRGTNNAALASTALSNTVWTDAKAGYLTGAVALDSTVAKETTLVAVGGYIDTEIATILGYVDCLPASWVVPAAAGAQMDLVNAPNATAVAAIKTAMEADGSKLDHIWEMTEDDLGVRRFTTNALEQAPSGGLDAAGVRAAIGMAAADLDDQLAAINTGAGSGARTVTITVNDGTDPLENATVRLTSGIESYVASTNASGQATFHVDDATWTVTITKTYYTYAGTTIVVAGNATATYSMTAQSITPPASASLCTLQFRVKLSDTAVSGAVCKAKLTGINHAADGTILSNAESSDTTDAQGIAELQLVQKGSIVKGSGLYKLWVEIAGKPVASVETAIPNQSSVLFEDLIK